LDNEVEQRERVRQLQERFNGPIRLGSRGSQPFVEYEKLILWWNELENNFEDLVDRERDECATVADQHPYGRSGMVIPEIGGAEKRRRAR
jgi:hypothetical protein